MSTKLLLKAGEKNVLLTFSEAEELFTKLGEVFDSTAISTHDAVQKYIFRASELNCLSPVERPVPVWGYVDSIGTASSTLSLEFSKSMADPVGLHAQFSYEAGTASGTATLLGITDYKPNVINITIGVVLGDSTSVNVTYKAGTVKSRDGGELRSFSKYPIDR